MKRIHLRLDYTARCWVAEHYRDDLMSVDPDVVDLFGTHVLPTAFTLRAPRATVLTAIRERNPDSIVEVLS